MLPSNLLKFLKKSEDRLKSSDRYDLKIVVKEMPSLQIA